MGIWGGYGSNDGRDRRELWDELAWLRDELVVLMSWWEMPWCIGGDCNVARFPSERLGVSGYSAAIGELSDFIFVENLVDLLLEVGQFTWSNNQEDQTWSRIDRLISPGWEEFFPEMTQRRLPRLLSYYFPLLLDCGAPRRGSMYFKFENMWLKSDGFVDQVKTWWMSYEFYGLPSLILAN
jgi:hypothetical protein